MHVHVCGCVKMFRTDVYSFPYNESEHKFYFFSTHKTCMCSEDLR